MSADPFETRLPEAFGRVLVRRRIERNMTPEALAVKADLGDTRAVSVFERGDAPPTLTEFFKIAEALGEQPGFLFVDVVAQWRGDGTEVFYKTRPGDFERLYRLGYYHKTGDFREQDKTYGSIAEATNVGGTLNEQRHELRC